MTSVFRIAYRVVDGLSELSRLQSFCSDTRTLFIFRFIPFVVSNEPVNTLLIKSPRERVQASEICIGCSKAFGNPVVTPMYTLAITRVSDFIEAGLCFILFYFIL